MPARRGFVEDRYNPIVQNRPGPVCIVIKREKPKNLQCDETKLNKLHILQSDYPCCA